MPGDGDRLTDTIERPTAREDSAPPLLPLRIDIDSRRQLNFAIVENAIPLVERISITNTGIETLQDLTVRVSLHPDFGELWSTRVAALASDSTYHLTDVDLNLPRERFVNLLESEQAELFIEAVDSDGRTSESRVPVELLAYNEWHAGALPQLLSAFVMPNHPVIGEVLSLCRPRLERMTGSPALDGYQSQSSPRARAITAAIYETLQALDITYINPPASFESSGQKIRTPEQVLEHRMGTCLDLTVFLAACLEQAGLHPLLFVIKGHALPGVWLQEEDLAIGATDDSALFRKLHALGAAIAFDSSAVASRPLVSFYDAQRTAMDLLADDDQFLFAVDVKGSRRLRFRPLPARLPRAFVLAEPPAPPQRAADPEAARTRTAILERTKNLPELEVPESAEPASPTPARIEVWKHKLLDLSLRNKLISFRETKASLRLLCPDIAAFEDRLASGAEFVLRGKPRMLSEDDPRHAEQLLRRAGENAVKEYLAETLDKGLLHTDQADGEADRRAKDIARQARETLEETGANTLCFAIGMLRWFESDTSDIPRLAPILLVPARIEKRKDLYCVASSDDDARINITLLEKLRNDFDIVVPDLDELPEDDAGIDVSRILSAFRAAVIAKPRWDVVEEVYLAHFTFTKFMMWRDLEDCAGSLLENELVRHLVSGQGQAFPDQGELPDAAAIDDRYRPGDLPCPLDADSTQLAAIAAGLEEKTFVLQGPPGTGKSQTITNLIAAGLAKGKRILFVAEKRAALEVVHRRLTQAKLGDFCLEIHSHKANKRAVIDELARTLEVARTAEPHTWPERTDRLASERDRLNSYVRALHEQRQGGPSVFRALSELVGLRDAPAMAVDTDYFDPTTRQAAHAAAENLARTAREVIPIVDNPWRCTRPPGFGFTTQKAVAEAISHLDVATATLAEAVRTSGIEQLASPPSSEREITAWSEALALLADNARPPVSLLERASWPQAQAAGQTLVTFGRALDHRRQALLERYQEAIFGLELQTLLARFKKWGSAFFLIAWWMLRSARAALRKVSTLPKLPAASTLTQDLEIALEVNAQTAELKGLLEAASPYFGEELLERDWGRIEAMLGWACGYHEAMEVLGASASPAQEQKLLALTQAGPPADHRLADAITKWQVARRHLADLLGCAPEDLSGPADSPGALPRLQHNLKAMRDGLPSLRSWHQYTVAESEAKKLGLTPLVDALRAGAIHPDALPSTFRRAFLEDWLDRTMSGDGRLASFQGSEHRERIARFAREDEQLMTLAGEVARARILQRFPQSSAQVAGTGEVGVLRREAAKKRRLMPIRRLFERIPLLVERLKPCILMSPLSVSQYLDPKAAPFDLVIFDEASQIPTHDAIGALARGRKAIVVGDSKQLPPTMFFSRASEDDPVEDDAVVELESILDECVASRVPELMLGWHYRSRHESLIAFSNYHYYANRLHTFPSPTERHLTLGVSLRQVSGQYDRGKSSTNRREAEAVVAEVVARLTDPQACRRSIGIVTFSRAQQILIEDLLDEARRANPDIEPFFGGEALEPVIVKNLENIQGDERDVMLFSICYGPDAHGRVSMSFGPLNQEGGERRLNVAITRAREQLIVFSTLRADQIDLTRTKARGVQHLKTFLEYAARGPRAIAEATDMTAGADFDSPFEKDVCDRLTERGWVLEPQVGCGGYRIDLGVKHPDRPGEFILGIECDGAAYHSAKSARDRDRLRAQVLSGLGWRLHRIWSSDWWHQPEREIERAEEAIRAALTQPEMPHRAASVTDAEAPRTEEPTGPSDANPASAPDSHEGDARAMPGVLAGSPETGGLSHPIYEPAPLPSEIRRPEDVYDRSYADELSHVIAHVIKIEAPITLRVLARRIAPYWGLAKASKRLERQVVRTLAGWPQDKRPVEHGDALWRPDQIPAESGFRLPGSDSQSRRSASDIPIDEIANAACFILQASLSLEREDLAREAARLLGFARVGSRVAARMDEAIELLLATNRAASDKGLIHLPR